MTDITNADGHTLDRLYNNRALVPDHAAHFARWMRNSELARNTPGCHLDLAYGADPHEQLDIFPGSACGAPVLFLIHGGYWRSLDKADYSFVAPAFTRSGACVVIPNYSLCPEVPIADIVLQMVKALAWTWRNVAAHGGDPLRITLVGHSAGGHLVAMLMTCLWQAYADDLPSKLIKNGLSISGLYELDSVRRSPYLQDSLQLTAALARMASPAGLPRPTLSSGRGALYSVVGGQESAAFLHHNRLLQKAWGKRVVPVCEELPGLNHFSILEALTEPGQRLHGLALELLHGGEA